MCSDLAHTDLLIDLDIKGMEPNSLTVIPFDDIFPGDGSFYWFEHVIASCWPIAEPGVEVHYDMWLEPSLPPSLNSVTGTNKWVFVHRSVDSYIDGSIPAMTPFFSSLWTVLNDPWFLATSWGALGLRVESMALYTKTGEVYVKIADSEVTSDDTDSQYFSLPLDPAPFTVLAWPPGLDIYLGVKIDGCADVQYMPFVRYAESPDWVVWTGWINGPDCIKAMVISSQVWTTALFKCGVMPLPTGSISATPTTIEVGGSSTLSWTTSGATSVSIDNGIGAVADSGSLVVSPAVATLYVLTVVGPGGTITPSASVTIHLETYTVDAEIDGDTMEVTGTGTGTGPTWEVVRVGDSVVMDSGSGTDAVFSFTGAYDVDYELRYGGSGSGLGFSFESPAPAFAPAWAYWKMEEAAGNSRADSSGNGRSLTETDDPVERAAGKLGYGAFFDGIPDGTQKNLSASCPDLTGNAKFMVSFWLKHHVIGTPDYCDLYSELGDGGYCGFTIGSYGDDPNNVHISAYTRSRDVETGYVITPDVDHFICIYYDQTGLYIEVDNVLIDSDLGVSGASWYGGNVEMGGLYEDGQISFVIDDFGYWYAADAQDAIDNRADLWNGGAGYSPY